ncbi:uncharacterized protein AAEQ78_018534 [Lycaon pictus]
MSLSSEEVVHQALESGWARRTAGAASCGCGERRGGRRGACGQGARAGLWARAAGRRPQEAGRGFPGALRAGPPPGRRGPALSAPRDAGQPSRAPLRPWSDLLTESRRLPRRAERGEGNLKPGAALRGPPRWEVRPLPRRPAPVAARAPVVAPRLGACRLGGPATERRPAAAAASPPGGLGEPVTETGRRSRRAAVHAARMRASFCFFVFNRFPFKHVRTAVFAAAEPSAGAPTRPQRQDWRAWNPDCTVVRF